MWEGDGRGNGGGRVRGRRVRVTNILCGCTDVIDKCATEEKFTREEQDNFAITSYQRAAAAWEAGKFDNEIVPVAVPQRKGDPIIVDKDEEYTQVNLSKIPQLNPVFTKDG